MANSSSSRRDWLVPLGLVLLHVPPNLFGAMRLLGLAVGHSTLPEHERITTYPLLLVVHIVAAPIFAVLGAFQFGPAQRWRRWHRVVGRLVAPLGVLAAAAGIGLAIALPLGEGDTPLLRGLRVVSGCAMLGFLVVALRALRRHEYGAHGAWMTRAYALGAAAGTQFFTVAPYVLLLGGRSVPITVLLMSAGWAINIAVAEWSLGRRAGSRSRRVAAALALGLWFAPRGAEAAEPEEGVDNDRVKVLLDAAAESGRDRRILDGAGALGHGVIFAGAGVASWVTESTASARELRDVVGGVLVGVGGLMIAGGAYSLATSSDLEVRRDAYARALRERPADLEAARRDAERAIFAAETAAKTERVVTGVFAFVFGAAEITSGLVLEATTDDPGLRWLGRGLLAGGIGAGILGASTLAVRSEDERLADLWRRERAAPSRSALSFAPRLGFGSVGLAGTF